MVIKGGITTCYECIARKRKFPNESQNFAEQMLRELYKNHTPKEIGEMIGKTGSSVTNWLHYFGIAMRSKGCAGRTKRI